MVIDFKACVLRIFRSHSIFVYHDAMMNAFHLNEDGTTSLGCEVPDHSTCYRGHRGAG